MRIYLVSGIHPTITTAGGARSYTLGLAKNLTRRGHQVYLVGAGPEAQIDFCEFISVARKFPLSEYSYIHALWTWLRKRPLVPDSIVHCQRPDELWPFVRKSSRTSFVCTLHGDPARGVAQRRRVGRLLYHHAEKLALKGATRIISVSTTGLDAYLKRFPWLRSKSCVIPIGIDLTAFLPIDRESARSSLDLPPGPMILFVGRLETEKRVQVILEAMRDIPNPPLLLVAGDGRLGNELRKRALGLPVRFLGTRDHLEMPKLYSAADALVLPSAYEGMPTVVLEALACGTPIISTRVGDLESVISEGRTGFFFDGTPADLNRVLIKRMSSLSALRLDCRRSSQGYGWGPIAERVLDIYTAAEQELKRP